MRRLFLGLAGIAAWCLSITAPQGAPAKPRPAAQGGYCRPGDPATSSLPPIALRIAFDRSAAAGGGPAITLRVRNTGDAPFVIWSSGFWPNHSVRVTNAAGKEPPLTDFGRTRRRSVIDTKTRGKNSQITLHRGESWSWPVLELTRLYRLARGTYTVRVTYDETRPPNAICIISNALTFRVPAGP